MVRNIIERVVAGDKFYIEAAGLTTDEKPVENIITGSRFFEVDSGDIFVYEESTRTWWKQ